MAWNSIRGALVCSVAIGLLSGCGGGDGSSSSPPPITVTPPPLPPPPPPPPPPDPPPSSMAQLVGAVPGQTLHGVMACANDPVQRDTAGHVTGIAALTGAKIDNSVALLFRNADSYALDINGFGGSAFAPGDKQTSPTIAFDYFLNGDKDAFYLARNNPSSGARSFATHGLYIAPDLCFFAAGLPATSLPTSGTGEYHLLADGLARIGNENLRLLPSYTDSRLSVDYQTGTATLTMVLGGRPGAFAEFTDKPAAAITTATATLQLNAQSRAFSPAPLVGSGGYTGTVHGTLVGNSANVSGYGGSAAVFTFELRNAAGEVVFGVVTAERLMI